MAHQVLHILGTAQPEGTSMARLVAALARGLDPQRYRIHAWFLAGDGPLIGTLERAGARASAVDWRRGARDPIGAWNFWRRLRHEEFEIAHIHFGARSVRWLARAGTQAKIVVHLHGRILEPRGLRLITHSGRGADAVVAVSQAVAQQVVEGVARVIYPGVSAPRSEPLNPGRGRASEIILGSAGRLIELKGIELLLRAAAILRREFPDLRIEIAGAGPQREKLEQAAAQLGLEGRVSFLGWVDDLNSVLSRWDVFVMPSLEEGLGIGALEAMAAGLPVVASSVGGIPELIEDGKTGWLVPPADLEALASCLRSVLRNSEQRRIIGGKAQARVRDHFSAAQMADNFARLYDELLAETQT